MCVRKGGSPEAKSSVEREQMSNARCFPLLLLLLLSVDPGRAQGGEDKFGQMEVATLAIFMAFGIGTVLFVLEKIVGRCEQSAAGFPV